MRHTEASIRDSKASVKAVPVYELVPLEYRIALDASALWLAHNPPLRLRCDQPALQAELEQRLPFSLEPPWQSGLWLEPQRASWQAALAHFSTLLPIGAYLSVLLSLPPSRRLRERHSWPGDALGEHAGGLDEFLKALSHQRFEIISLYGLHCGQAIMFNTAALAVRKLGRMALGDRLEFTARQHYIRPFPRAWRATCSVLLAMRH